MALVPMTKEQFVERWQKDALKRIEEKKERERRERDALEGYITEQVTKRMHKYHRKAINRRFGA